MADASPPTAVTAVPLDRETGGAECHAEQQEDEGARVFVLTVI